MTGPNDHDGGSDDSPLRRWSRRKQAARERGAVDAPPDASPSSEPAASNPPAEAELEPPQSAHPGTESQAAAAADDADPPTDEDMPPLESLDADSDYSQFMSPRVSDSLRRMALRKLFGMSSFNIRDGLDDYDEDFTRYQSLGDTVTADMKYHARRHAERAERERDAANEAHDAEVSSAEDAPPAEDTADPIADNEAPRTDEPDADEEPADDRA